MPLSHKVRQLVEEALRVQKRPSGGKEAARRVLGDPHSPAVAVYLAAHTLFGPDMRAFEPETFWLQMDLPLVNRDKLMAALALDVRPAFYWDYRVLCATTEAFSNTVTTFDEVNFPNPAELAWATVEAELIFSLFEPEGTVPEFDGNCERFVAACLFHAGCVLAPEPLLFADPALEALLSDEGRELRTAVKKAWNPAEPHPPEEDTALGVQLARLAHVHHYLTARADACLSCLRAL